VCDQDQRGFCVAKAIYIAIGGGLQGVGCHPEERLFATKDLLTLGCHPESLSDEGSHAMESIFTYYKDLLFLLGDPSSQKGAPQDDSLRYGGVFTTIPQHL